MINGYPGRASVLPGARIVMHVANGAVPAIRKRPPLLGEHSDEVLDELGYSTDVIARLRERGIV